MKLTSESKFLIGIGLFTVLIIAIAAFIFTRPPAPPKPVDQALLINDSVTSKGSSTPSATLVEFSDYQCPACSSFAPVVEDIINKYPDQLRFVYRHFPLDQHQFAYQAALAAEAAGKQGKYWPMHQLLFENQNDLKSELFPEFAKKLNLNMDKFNSDFNSRGLKDKVERDRADGFRLGIDATPTFYLNTVKLSLNNPSDLVAAVDKFLSK